VSFGEQEIHWLTFLQSLIARGLCGVQQNSSAYVPRKDMRAEVAADVRTIFNSPDRQMTEAYL